jgi:hypothetical protein
MEEATSKTKKGKTMKIVVDISEENLILFDSKILNTELNRILDKERIQQEYVPSRSTEQHVWRDEEAIKGGPDPKTGYPKSWINPQER